MSEIKVNKVSPATGTAIQLGDSGDTFTVPSGATIVNSGTATGFGGGKVLQCLQAVQTAAVTSTSSSLVDVTGLSQAITPSATSSKILILVTLNSTAGDSGSVFQLMRDTTEIFKGDTGDSGETLGSLSVYGSAGSTHMMSHASICFLDSPSSTSSITFKLQWKAASGTNYLNKNRRDSGSSDTRTASSITVMEIGA